MPRPRGAAYSANDLVDTVNDRDNALYEVINEGGEKEWDWWLVDTVRQYERTQPHQHPIGITGHGAWVWKSVMRGHNPLFFFGTRNSTTTIAPRCLACS